MAGRPVAALTGATGFLGTWLVRALAAQGFAVRVLARREPDPPGWGDVRPEVIAGDLSDSAALARLVKGAAVVIHAAGAIRAPDRAGFMAVNRDGTERLARLIEDATPLVLVSSLAARHPELSDYAASKRAGEMVAEQILPGRVAVVRPPAIYGPGDRATLAVFRMARTSPVLPVLSPEARVALIHAEDAAAVVAAVARSPTPGTWAIADAREGYGWREILSAAAASVGRKPALIAAPGWLIPPLGRAAAALGLVSKAKIDEILHTDWAVRPGERLPGAPAPIWGLTDGFAATAKWYQDAGWMK